MATIPGLAVLRYDFSDYAVVKPGQFVLCAVTGQRIPLDELTYWSWERQEAYRGPQEATKAMLGGAMLKSPAASA